MSLLSSLCLAVVLAAPTPGPTVAREDTMSTSVSEVLVRAPRVTLDEILDRVARGEARRESLIVDQQFTATFRMLTGVGTPKGPQLYFERMLRVYKKKPDKVRSVLLRQWDRKKESDNDVDLDFRSGMDEEIVNFAFRPEARKSFRYHIAGRDVLGNHLIYRIAFEPRSLLDPTEPSGTVWIDTNEFVIVRQEIRFDRSPVPLFIKDVHRMVIERQKFGDTWVLNRVMMRIETSIPLPTIGRGFDIAMRFDDYAINAGIPDSVFATRARN